MTIDASNYVPLTDPSGSVVAYMIVASGVVVTSLEAAELVASTTCATEGCSSPRVAPLTICADCRASRQAASEDKLWQASVPIKPGSPEAPDHGWVTYKGRFFESVAECLETSMEGMSQLEASAWLESARIYWCKEVRARSEAENVIHEALDGDFSDDRSCDISAEDQRELQAFLDGWWERQSIRAFYRDVGKRVDFSDLLGALSGFLGHSPASSSTQDEPVPGAGAGGDRRRPGLSTRA